jgi:hypothetical protein
MRSLSSKASGCIFPRKLLATPSVSPQVQKNQQNQIARVALLALRRFYKLSKSYPTVWELRGRNED